MSDREVDPIMAMMWMCFVSLVSIKEHPRNSGGADLEGCLDLAERMYYVFAKRAHEKAGRNIGEEN